MDVAQFREDFPEFASVTDYPTAQVNFWAGIASKLVDLDRWGDLYDQGISLFVAHNLVLQRRNIAGAASGGSGGLVGSVSSKSVGAVSVSYDVNAVMESGAGQWNLTSYGLQYIQLARMIGAGGVQL